MPVMGWTTKGERESFLSVSRRRIKMGQVHPITNLGNLIFRQALVCKLVVLLLEALYYLHT